MTLIILEGPDGSGKTTLANWLAARKTMRIVKHGPYHGATSQLLPAIYESSLGDQVVLDRSWLSEPIYGSVMRGGADRIGTPARRVLERAALEYDAIVVLTLPSYETCERTWKARPESEYLPSPEQLHAVYKLYDQGLDTDLPLFYYNYTRDHPDLVVGWLDFVPEFIDSMRSSSSLVVVKNDRYRDPLDPIALSISEGFEEAGVSEISVRWVVANDDAPYDLSRERHVFGVGIGVEEWIERRGAMNYDIIPIPRYLGSAIKEVRKDGHSNYSMG